MCIGLKLIEGSNPSLSAESKYLNVQKRVNVEFTRFFALISDTTQKTTKVGHRSAFVAFNRGKSSFLYPNWVAIW